MKQWFYDLTDHGSAVTFLGKQWTMLHFLLAGVGLFGLFVSASFGLAGYYLIVLGLAFAFIAYRTFEREKVMQAKLDAQKAAPRILTVRGARGGQNEEN